MDGRGRASFFSTPPRFLRFRAGDVPLRGPSPRIDQTDMVTWDDYIANCQKLDESLSGQGVEGCLLNGQPWIADWTLPYAWMQGGDTGVPDSPQA